MKRETTTFIIQQLIVISILVLVNVYYYQRLSSTFVDKSLVKHTGAIEQMKSQIGLSLNMEDIQNFTTFMGKVKTDYSDSNIKNISSYNPLNVIKEGYESVQNDSGQSNTTTNNTTKRKIPRSSVVIVKTEKGPKLMSRNEYIKRYVNTNDDTTTTNDTTTNETQEQENVEQTTLEQNTSEQNTSEQTTSEQTTPQQPTSIITCQEVIEQYPQKDMNFSISGTNLDDFQTMFKNVKKLQMVCKQQIPIGSIIPFAYYYEKDGSQQYKMLLNESDNTVKNVQILLRTTDNLVLVPLLGGVLTQAMVSKVLGDDCLFIKSVLSKSGNQMTLPNTTKKVLKQVMNGQDQQNLDNSNQSGYAKLIQKIKKTTLFFHDLQNNASWKLQDQGMIYTSPPPNWEIEAKRGGVARRKSTYNVDQGRNEESTKTYYNSQQLTGDEEIDIQDDYAQALFCMVIGYK